MPACPRVAQRRAAARRRPGAARVVVLHLVVVPDRDHREARVHPPQRAGRCGTGAYLARYCSSVSEKPTGSVRTPPSPSFGRVVRLGVDVVAQVDDEVDVLRRQQRVRVEVPEACSPGRRRTRSAPAARESGGSAVRKRPTGLSSPARGEAVLVLLVRAQVDHARLDRVRRARSEVRISSRATTRRKPRSRATSSSTVPLPSDVRRARVHSGDRRRGVGSPDSTPSAKRPPRRLGRLRGLRRTPEPVRTAAATTMPPAPARKPRRDMRVPRARSGQTTARSAPGAPASAA